MKKIILATAMAVTFGSSYVFAHHPAADIIDPEIFAMIDDNLEGTPHGSLEEDLMADVGSDDNMGGSDDAAGNNAREAADIEVGQGQGGPRS